MLHQDFTTDTSCAICIWATVEGVLKSLHISVAFNKEIYLINDRFAYCETTERTAYKFCVLNKRR